MIMAAASYEQPNTWWLILVVSKDMQSAVVDARGYIVWCYNYDVCQLNIIMIVSWFSKVVYKTKLFWSKTGRYKFEQKYFEKAKSIACNPGCHQPRPSICPQNHNIINIAWFVPYVSAIMLPFPNSLHLFINLCRRIIYNYRNTY